MRKERSKESRKDREINQFQRCGCSSGKSAQFGRWTGEVGSCRAVLLLLLQMVRALLLLLPKFLILILTGLTNDIFERSPSRLSSQRSERQAKAPHSRSTLP